MLERLKKMFIGIEGEQNMPSQNTPLWHNDYFRLIIYIYIKNKASRHGKCSEN